MDYVWDAFYHVGLTSSPSLASVPLFDQDCQCDLDKYYQVDPEVIGQGSFASIRRVKPIKNNNVESSSQHPNVAVSESKNSIAQNDANPSNNTTQSDDDFNRWNNISQNDAIFNRYYACKTISKSHDRDIVLREVYNLNRCQANNNCVIRLVDVLEDRYAVHIVTELCEGGELFEYVTKEHDRTGTGLRGKALSPDSKFGVYEFDETRCATIIHQILIAFVHLHEDARVCHRDAKASNFVFVKKPCYIKGSLELRMIDFGLSTFLGNDNKEDAKALDCRYMTSEVGTPYYVAPEVLRQQSSNNGYTTKCDIWSVGVLAFLTLTGDLPVMGIDEQETVEKLMDPDLEIDFSDAMLWEQDENDVDEEEAVDPKKKPRISNAARLFCQALLQKDPTKRPTAREALGFEWIKKHFGAALPPDQQHKNKQPPSRLPSLSRSILENIS